MLLKSVPTSDPQSRLSSAAVCAAYAADCNQSYIALDSHVTGKIDLQGGRHHARGPCAMPKCRPVSAGQTGG